MLRSLHVENFRAFKSLTVEGLDRVNLVIGLNDCGKTSLLAAAAFSDHPLGLTWAAKLAGSDAAIDDLDRVWRAVPHGGDLDTAPSFRRIDAEGQLAEVDIRVVPGKGPTAGFNVLWTVDGAPEESELFQFGKLKVYFPAGMGDDDNRWWSGTQHDGEDELIVPLKRLYAAGGIDRLAESVRRLHPDVRRVDLVGERIWVVLEGHPLPLPRAVLGDGSRRLLEFAVPVALRAPALYVDEIENGFHWSALAKVWSFLRESEIGQIFATTHREECIRVACETFQDAGDDSLRIVRLDRTADGGHRAVVYTAATALAAMDAGLEIRG